MKMLVGPYTGRFFGNLPIIYQKFLLDNIKRIDKTASHNGELVPWLEQHRVRINRQVRVVPTIKFMEQMKATEVLCGLEFQPRSPEGNEGKTEGNAPSIGGKSYIPIDTSGRSGTNTPVSDIPRSETNGSTGKSTELSDRKK